MSETLGMRRLILTIALAAQGPVFQSETRIVEVAIVARDSRNAAIPDLRKTDLRVFDNGTEQTVVSLDKLGDGWQQPDGRSTNDTTQSRPAPRVSIILLDSLNTVTKDQYHGRMAISKMLGALPQGENFIAIFALGDDLRLLHDFSMNVESLRSTVDSYAGEEPNIGIVAAPPYSGPASASAAYGDSFQERRLEKTIDVLTEIARRMKSVTGEKSLIWMTSGFPPPLDHSDIGGATRELAAARVRVYPIDARGLMTCPRLPCPPDVGLNIQSMEELAEQTGGRAYHDDNGLSALARSALDDSRPSCQLTYAPNNYRRDGSTHQVQLKTSRKGVVLRYRPWYTADSAK
jgi:VWFA-related protein